MHTILKRAKFVAFSGLCIVLIIIYGIDTIFHNGGCCLPLKSYLLLPRVVPLLSVVLHYPSGTMSQTDCSNKHYILFSGKWSPISTCKSVLLSEVFEPSQSSRNCNQIQPIKREPCQVQARTDRGSEPIQSGQVNS